MQKQIMRMKEKPETMHLETFIDQNIGDYDGFYNDNPKFRCCCDPVGFLDCTDQRYNCKLGYKHQCDCEETDHSKCYLIILPTKDTSPSDIPFEI